MTQTVPVTLLTGFLGSGKTTLLNRMIDSSHGEKLAVVVNEFGDIGIDGSLVVGSTDDLIELRNGCICCTVRGDLQGAVLRLLKRRERKFLGRLKFDRIVIEASGMASPGPILQTFLLDAELQQRVHVDGVITLTHAGNIVSQLNEYVEAEMQLGYADRVLLNHCDQVKDLSVAWKAIRGRLPNVDVIETVQAQVDIGQLLDIGTSDPTRWKLAHDHDHDHAHNHAHTHGVRAIGLTSETPVDLHKLKIWLQHVTSRRTHELVRLKGVLECRGQAATVVVHGMYQWLELGPSEVPRPECSRIVFIGRDLDEEELRRGWSVVCS